MPSIRAAATHHKGRHAADGPDPIRPEDIGAAALYQSATPGLLDYTTPDGTPPPEPEPVTVVTDTFTRSGELNGSTADSGQAWTSTPGSWSCDGARAALAASPYLASIPTGRTGDMTVTASITLDQSGGVAKSFRLYSNFAGRTTASLWTQVSVNASGIATATLWKRIAGTATQLASLGTIGTTDGGTNTFDVSVSLSGLTVTGSANGVTGSGAILADDLAALGGDAGLDSSNAGTIGSLWVNSLTVVAPGTTPTPDPDGKIVTASDEGALPAVVLDALDARYGGGGGGGVVTDSALDALRIVKDFGSTGATVAVVSDSTGNDGGDWPRLFARKWGALHPAAIRRTYRLWNNTAGEWGTETVDAEGSGGDTGIIVDDTFTRTGAIHGSTAGSGQTWSDTSGHWTADGTHAVPSGSGTLSVDLGSKDNTTVVDFTVVTAAEASNRIMRIYSGLGGGNTVWAYLTINTSGIMTVTLSKTIGGTTTTLASGAIVNGVTYDSATPQAVRLELVVSIQNVTCTVTAGGQTTTLTGTITEEDVSGLGTSVGLIFTTGYALGGFTVDRWQGWTPAAEGGGPEPTTLAVYNGSMGGASLTTFNEAKRAEMFGALDVDVLILAMGHNHGGLSATAFVAAVEAWVAAWLTEHPDCLVLISSQNPQVSPATNVVAHRDRQAALRLWAKRNSHDYIPAYEAFTALPDGGASLIVSDGVHPTTPPSGTTGDYGAVLWADTAVAALEA